MAGGVISKVIDNNRDENATMELDVITSGIPATLTSVKTTANIPTTKTKSSEGASVTASTIANVVNQKTPESNSGGDEESISMMVFIYVVSYCRDYLLPLHFRIKPGLSPKYAL